MNSVWSSTTFLYLFLALGQQFLAFCKFVVILPEFFFGRCQLFIGGIEFLVFLPELLFNPLVFGNVNGNTENGLLVVAGRSEGDFGRLEETVFSECINIRFFRNKLGHSRRHDFAVVLEHVPEVRPNPHGT